MELPRIVDAAGGRRGAALRWRFEVSKDEELRDDARRSPRILAPPRRAAPRPRAAAAVPAAAEAEAPAPEADADADAAAPETPFPVVGIGASAGGIAAFEAFFAAMPEDSVGMAFVLVQHLARDHKSVLADLVRRCTRLQVDEIVDGMAVQPDHVYIIPPNHDLTLEAGTLRLAQHGAQRVPHPTIDHFFESLAQSQRERAICIVMSGTGSDGTQGLRAVKGEGGLTIAQAPETAEYDGMPRSAVDTGMVDHVLAPADMPARLIAYARHAFDPALKPPAPQRGSLLKKLCMLLRAQTGHDFSQYKETTLLRRMERRMALCQIADAQAYLRYARQNVQEVETLFHDLLIGVTCFFRDPDAFKVLDEKVIPRLLAHKAAHETLRVWVSACSTGEEAYSIAILLFEQMTKLKRPVKVQIFATDIDARAIEQARAGVYPASIAAQVSEERLNRFFSYDAQRGTYRIQKQIRDLLVFSEQDIIKDPPFSRLDLVSCRNLLIYLNAELQRKLIALFHYALLPGGALFLGTSETVGDSASLFHAVDRKWKLYDRRASERGDARPALPAFVPPLSDPRGARGPARAGDPPADGHNLRQLAERGLIEHSGQVGVLIDSRGQILHIVGRTGRFLEPADGDAAMNVFAMAREGLRRELTVAVHKAVSHKQPVSYPGLSVRSNGDTVRADLAVRPLEVDGGATLYLVILGEQPAHPSDAGQPLVDADQTGRIAELERELRAKDEYLQTTLEEMETTNEELKSTNEEMQSINEELQSTNEELETSKEELQSVNEELSTVNAELQDKVADLSRANNDMNNLLAGTGVGTVFVDHRLCISRFTPAATQVINLIASDVGRPLEHVASNIVGYDRMVDDIAAVLEHLTPREAEVQVKSGAWYLMRIRPYRTMDNLIEGAVVTFVDISERKKAEESLRRSQERLNAFIHQAYAGVCEIDLDGRFRFANDRLCEMLGYARAELLRKTLSDITEPADIVPVRERFAAIAQGGADAQVERDYVRRDGSRLRVVERVSAIRDAGGATASLLALSFERAEPPAPPS